MFRTIRNPCGPFCAALARYLCKSRADRSALRTGVLVLCLAETLGDRHESFDRETCNRDHRRRAYGCLRQRFQRRLCRRNWAKRGRSELRLQRLGQRFARRTLCRHQASVRRKVLRQLLQWQDAFGDVRSVLAHRADINAMARTTIQPTITRDVTAPAVIFVISLKVVGRSIAIVMRTLLPLCHGATRGTLQNQCHQNELRTL